MVNAVVVAAQAIGLKDGRCVGWADIGRKCGDPPTTRCKAELPKAGADAAAKSGLKAIEAGKRKSDMSQ